MTNTHIRTHILAPKDIKDIKERLSGLERCMPDSPFKGPGKQMAYLHQHFQSRVS